MKNKILLMATTLAIQGLLCRKITMLKSIMKKTLINSCACYGSNDIHECYCNLNNNNMKQQTAVEWLYETLWKQTDFSLPNNIFEEAKAMEKQQLEDAWINGMKSNNNNFEGI